MVSQSRRVSPAWPPALWPDAAGVVFPRLLADLSPLGCAVVRPPEPCSRFGGVIVSFFCGARPPGPCLRSPVPGCTSFGPCSRRTFSTSAYLVPWCRPLGPRHRPVARLRGLLQAPQPRLPSHLSSPRIPWLLPLLRTSGSGAMSSAAATLRWSSVFNGPGACVMPVAGSPPRGCNAPGGSVAGLPSRRRQPPSRPPPRALAPARAVAMGGAAHGV